MSDLIKTSINKSDTFFWTPFSDSALYHLYQEGRISLDEALKNADAANNLRLRIELHEKGQDAEQTFSGLSIVEEPEEEDEDEGEHSNEPPPVFAPPIMDSRAGKKRALCLAGGRARRLTPVLAATHTGLPDFPGRASLPALFCDRSCATGSGRRLSGMLCFLLSRDDLTQVMYLPLHLLALTTPDI